ncbi:chaperonin 10-like protein [Hygrophoropsis aurantiaca]|uniref:Chaperonin 10-like protein n=1 Tax=Hygrophoropsis aurantiaca TaxID=72124 RepID=A0ACB8ANK3_9AGAM|nr:chaperonin 10-like protein [Hygrophoropsis aurantiaca]
MVTSQTQTALWLENKKFTIGTKDVEHPGPGEILVKNIATSLNSIDWKIRDHGFYMITEYPAVIGAEGAGIVESIGKGVIGLIKGDQVFYQSSLLNRSATFQQFVVLPTHLAAKVPQTLSLEQAASIAVAVAPAALGFYGPKPRGFEYLAPWEEGGRNRYKDQPIIIMGGASSLGQFASSFKYEVAKITSAQIELAFDTISQADTQQTLYDILDSEGKMIVSTPPVMTRKDNDKKTVLFVNGTFFTPDTREFGSRFMAALARMIADGEITTPAIEIVPNGLNGVEVGLERLKSNTVSGKKLVIRPWET